MPRKGWEEAPKHSPEVVFGSSERSWRGFGEVFKGLGKIERFRRGFGSREAPKTFFPKGKSIKFKVKPPREQTDR